MITKLTKGELDKLKFNVRGRYGQTALLEDMAKDLLVGQALKIALSDWPNKTNPNVSNLNKTGEKLFTTRTLLNQEGWVIIRVK